MKGFSTIFILLGMSFQLLASEPFNVFHYNIKELDSQKAEEEQLLEAELPKDEVFRHNYYNDEVLEITKDYVESLRRKNLARAG